MKTFALGLAILFPSLASADSTVLAATATAHSTSAAGVALAANGDFHIDDALAPAVPASCDNPVLLILSAANGHWFADGMPRNGSDTREE